MIYKNETWNFRMNNENKKNKYKRNLNMYNMRHMRCPLPKMLAMRSGSLAARCSIGGSICTD